jgi:hypothetical protein
MPASGRRYPVPRGSDFLTVVTVATRVSSQITFVVVLLYRG